MTDKTPTKPKTHHTRVAEIKSERSCPDGTVEVSIETRVIQHEQD